MKKIFFASVFLILLLPFYVLAKDKALLSPSILDFHKIDTLENAYEFQVEYPDEVREAMKYYLSKSSNPLKLVYEVEFSNGEKYTLKTDVHTDFKEAYSFKLDRSESSISFKLRVRIEDYGEKKAYTDWSDYNHYSQSTQKRVFLDSLGNNLVSKASFESAVVTAQQDNLKVKLATVGIILCCFTMLCLILCLRKSF